MLFSRCSRLALPPSRAGVVRGGPRGDANRDRRGGGGFGVLWAVAGLSGWGASSSSSSWEMPTRMEPDDDGEGGGRRRWERVDPAAARTLFVWDFDWTIVNCNSDEYIPAQFLDRAELDAGFRALLESGKDWHSCVEAMVGRAAAERGATRDDVLDAARRMPYLRDVRRALDDVRGFETVSVRRNERGGAPATAAAAAGQMILSDGNTLFIEAFLEGNGLSGHFSHGVVSNVGVWEDGGSDDKDGGGKGLCVVHQSAQYGGHDCVRCARSPNLCKTQALRDALDRWFGDPNGDGDADATQSCGARRRPRIVYIGDGANDACPAFGVLSEGDVLLARAGRKRGDANDRAGPETDEEAAVTGDFPTEGGKFGILPALRRAREGDPPVTPKCQVWEWRTGAELRRLVSKLLEDVAADNQN